MPDKMNFRVLVIDDDHLFHGAIRAKLGHSFEFDGLAKIENIDGKLIPGAPFDLILLDLELVPGSNEQHGLELLPEIQRRCPGIPIIVVTNDDKLDTAIAAVKKGADDYLHKKDGKPDYNEWELRFRTTIKTANLKKEKEFLEKEVKRLRDKETGEFPFVGESPEIIKVKKLLEAVANEKDVTVLITGETGSGKEVAARYLHRVGRRNNKPFVAVNLSAISESLLESELFGHIKGSFTGASQDKEGYFRQANGGVLMLDEIGDINQDIQIKLLRFLERKIIRPVGSDKDIMLDIQVVTATHQDLPAMVDKKLFRQDLYMRLKEIEVRLPPLRNRRDDLPLIIDHYLAKEGLSSAIIDPDVMHKLISFSWPGNIRQLVNELKSVLLHRKLNQHSTVTLELLPPEISDDRQVSGNSMGGSMPIVAVSTASPSEALSREEKLALTELRVIEQALLSKNFVKGDAAILAGLENTDNLRYCVKKHYQQFPDLFDQFPAIAKAFPKIVK